MTKLGSKSSGCVEAAIGLGPEDTSRLMELHQLYADAGLTSDAAIRKAANDLVAELNEEATDITKAVRGLLDGTPQFSNTGDRVHEFEMSTRVPSAVKRTEDPMANLLVADFASAQADTKWLDATAELVQSYPNYKRSRAKTTAGQLEHLIGHMVDNLLWLHDQVPAATRQRSKLWYDGARAIVDRWTKRYGITDAQAAGVLAVLSPQKDWFMNVSLARRVADVVTERGAFIWSPQMDETAARIFGKDAYEEDLDAIRGKSLDDLDDDYLMGMWVRVYDQAHQSPAFDIISPEGDAVAQAMTKTGALGRVAWGGIRTIAKAVSIMRGGDAASISAALGQQHKVRNFYNNILVPNSPNGHVTIDTHAVAASLLRALSGGSREVMHNFGGGMKGEVGAKSSKISGLQGTYALYEEAYRRAAEARGILPREMQSITWEAIRGMYLPRFKGSQKNVDAVDAVWAMYQKGKISHAEARKQVLALSGGIQPPSWSGPNPAAYDVDESADDAGDLPADGVPGADPGETVGGADRGSAGALPRGGREPQFSNVADRGGRGEGRDLAPLEGAPAIVGATGPDPRLVSVAERYASSNGISLKRQAEYVKVDPDRAARIAAAYEAMPHAPQDPKVREAFDNLIRQTRAQYDALVADGYEFTFFDDGADPYEGNPWNAMRDLRENKKMAVYGTYVGFGTEGITAGASDDNPMMADTGLQWRDQGGELRPVTANDLFRAVHDAFGHGLEGAGFRSQGEENAWQAHVRLFTGSAVAAITSETRGQNSWLNYGPYGETNRVAGVADTVFAPQKTGLMPEWAWTEGRAGDIPQFSNKPQFISQLAQAVSQAPNKMDGMPATQWKVWVKSNASKAGVKADEITWSGIEDYLDLRGKDKLTRQDVADFLSQNGVKVEETMLGGEEAREGAPGELTVEQSDFGDWAVFDEEGAQLGGSFDTEEEAIAAREEMESSPNQPTKYHGYRVPGGDNYREVLVTLPRKERAGKPIEDDGTLENFALKPGEPTIDRAPEYRSKHWDQPNVLVHFRADDRTDADGNRVLFLHDLQSDWGQDGKKKGFAGQEIKGYQVQWDGRPIMTYATEEEAAEHVARAKSGDPAAPVSVIEVMAKPNAQQDAGKVPSAPFITETKSWVSLGLKRAIMMAVEAGQDRVAMVNGEQAADMFDLSKSVDSIGWLRGVDGGRRVTVDFGSGHGAATMKVDAGGTVVSAQGSSGALNGAAGKPLDEVLGKGVAEAIMADESGQLSGSGLRIGGEGMKAFYDQIVPQVMRDVAKKLGGRVVTADIGTSVNNRVTDTKNPDYAPVKQTAIEITPEMREKVLGGVPMFSNKPGRLDDIEAYHFSKAQRMSLSGQAYGSNYAGSGKDDYLKAADPRRRQRIYFYVDKGTGINPEGGVGAYAHRATLSNVYDADSDPLNLAKGSQAATETAILDAGFDGYLSRLDGTQSGQVIMLGPQSIKVSPLPAGERPRTGKVVPPATKKAPAAKRSGDELVMRPAAEDMVAFVKARKAVEAAAPSFRMEYGEARVKVSEAAAADAAFEAAGAKFKFGGEPQFANTAKFSGQDLPAETRSQKARRVAQDYFLRTKVVQDVIIGRGGQVGEAQDVYRAEERMYGRVQAQLEDFAKKWVTPMIEKAAKAGIDMDELALYAYAKHAPERNAYIDTINPAMQGAGSGMSDADAAKIVADVQASGKAQQFEDLRQDLLAITETTRQVLLQDGLITQDEYDAWTGAYQDYVPLRGLENIDDEGRPKPGVGRGVNIRGQESTRALGRRSRAGEIVENIVRDYERAVIRGERNAVAKTFLDLVTTNPDPELWEVNAQKTNRSFSKTLGLVTTSTSTETGDDTVGVKVGGQQVYIKVKDPLLVRAMRQAAKDETGEFQSMLAKSLGVYNNWLRNTLTRYNPVFGAVNAVRDLQAGAVATLDKLGARGLKLYASHYRAALAASVRNEFDALGKKGSLFGDPVMDKWFDEYRRAGGTTAGWFLRDVEDIHTDIRQMLVAAGSAPRNTGERITGSVAWQGAKALLKYVELFGSASENAGRVAAYRAAREMGRSPAEAASIAKNLTTNFNRKGEWGTALSSAYLFFNAAVQGTARVLEALKSPHVQGLMAGVTGLAATLAVMGASMGGDDDDGQAYWDKIPQSEKERNLIIMLPPGIQTDGAQKVGGMGRYIKIPMPYGFNVFATLGYTMADVGRNAVDPARGVKPAKAAINMVSAVAGAYNPLGGSFDVTDPVAVGMAVAPTIVDAGIQLGAGVNSFGTPVGPKGSPFDSRPDSERFTVTQGGGAAQRLARWVNEATGGNRARSGAIDLMPGTIENVVNMAGGGTGRFLMDVFVNVPTKLSGTGDEEAVFRYRDLPFLRNFAGQVDENVDRGLFYERMDEVLKEARTAKNEMKMGIVVKYDPRSRAMQSLGKMADGYSGMMTDLRKEDLQIVNDPSLTAPEKKMMRRDVEKRRNELVREFNRIWIETERDLARGSFDKE